MNISKWHLHMYSCLCPSLSYKGEQLVCYFMHTYICYNAYVYVTRPAKIDQVGTFKYLRNTNSKYSMPHDSPVPDSSCVKFIQEAQQGNSY